MVCTFIDTLCNYTTCIMRSSRCYWSTVDCDGRACWSWLTASLLERLLGVLLFTEARSMGRPVLILLVPIRSQRVSWSGWASWSPMKPESELMRLVPIWIFADLLQSLTALRLTERAGEHANCTAGMYVLTGPRHLADCLKRIPRIALFMPWNWPKCRHRSQQFLCYCYYDCWLPR
jgi:hypothetical protein